MAQGNRRFNRAISQMMIRLRNSRISLPELVVAWVQKPGESKKTRAKSLVDKIVKEPLILEALKNNTTMKDWAFHQVSSNVKAELDSPERNNPAFRNFTTDLEPVEIRNTLQYGRNAYRRLPYFTPLILKVCLIDNSKSVTDEQPIKETLRRKHTSSFGVEDIFERDLLTMNYIEQLRDAMEDNFKVHIDSEHVVKSSDWDVCALAWNLANDSLRQHQTRSGFNPPRHHALGRENLPIRIATLNRILRRCMFLQIGSNSSFTQNLDAIEH